MEEDIKKIVEDYDLDEGEAVELQNLANETGLDIDDAYEIRQAV